MLACVTLEAGTLKAGLQRRLGRWTAVVATALGAAGFASAATFVSTGWLPWLVVAAPLLGAGGLCLAAGLTLTALFLAIAYIGFAAPLVMAVVARASSAPVPLAGAAASTGLLAVRLLLPARRRQL